MSERLGQCLALGQGQPSTYVIDPEGPSHHKDFNSESGT